MYQVHEEIWHAGLLHVNHAGCGTSSVPKIAHHRSVSFHDLHSTAPSRVFVHFIFIAFVMLPPGGNSRRYTDYIYSVAFER